MSLINKIDRKIRDLNHQRIDFFRAFLLQLSKSFFNLVHLSQYSGSGFDSIVVLRMDGKVGDSISATGFLKELKKQNSDLKLIVITSESSFFLYKNLEFIDEVYKVKKSFISILKACFYLSRFKIKYLVNTSHILNPRVIFLVSFTKAFRKITFLNDQFEMFTDHIQYDVNTDHVTKRYSYVLKTIASDQQNFNLQINQADFLKYEISLDPKSEQQAFNEINLLKQKDLKVILLNTFAGARLRNFNKQKTLQIVSELLAQNSQNVIISIGNHNDLPVVQKWITELNDSRWICFPNQFDFNFNCGLVKYADLVITPDTAVVHMASAFRKKLVCVYREDRGDEKNALIWAPFQAQARVVVALNDINNPDDINSFSVSEVVNHSFELLQD